MTEQFGPFDPDPTRPLRSEPVRREEVLIEVKQRGWPAEKWHLLTMPIATWQLVAEEVRSVLFGREVNYVSRHLVGAPALWQSLLAEPQARWSVGMDYSDYYKALNPREAGPVPEFLPSSRPGLFGPGIAAEYVCIWCGVRYLARESDGRRSRLCSNRCQELRHSALTKASRERRPRPDYAVINAPRAARRAEARAGRVCAHCGVAMAAARSTKRFCSDTCRVRHSRSEAAQ